MFHVEHFLLLPCQYKSWFLFFVYHLTSFRTLLLNIIHQLFHVEQLKHIITSPNFITIIKRQRILVKNNIRLTKNCSTWNNFCLYLAMHRLFSTKIKKIYTNFYLNQYKMFHVEHFYLQ